MTGSTMEGNYRAFFESAAVGLTIIDRRRRILECNEAYLEILGRPREDVIERPANAFNAPGSVDVTEAAIAELAAGATESFTVQKRYVRPDGVEIPVRVTTSALDRDRDLYIAVVFDLTETEEAQAEVREHRALLERAQELGAVGNWVWYEAEQRSIWSPNARRILGQDEANPVWISRLVHPDDRSIRNDETFLTAVDPLTIEYRIVRPSDGAVRWLRETGVAELDENGGLVRIDAAIADVTERRLAENAVAEQTLALRRAHELAKLGRFTIDIPGRLVEFSPETARLLAAPASELVVDVESFRSLYVQTDDAEHWRRSAEEAYSRGGPFAWESRLIRRDGTVIWARVHGETELDDAGRPVRAIGVVQDMTEQHALETQLLQAQKLEAVGQLAGGIAHDFNNLLTVIIGSAELATTAGSVPGSPFPRDDLDEIRRASARAAELVQQLLAYARADSSEPKVVDLNNAVQSVRRMLSRLLEEHIRVHSSLADRPAPVLLDPRQLEQVIVNLVVNARDAMPDGGQIAIATASSGDWVTLRVADTGVGMDEATQNRIFEPFFTTKEPGSGTGLGLSMVYGIVTRAGGSIAVDSTPGAGTTFTLRLPRAETEAEGPADVLPERRAETGTGERLLVVEDDAMVRSVAATILSRSGFDVVTAENGEEALELLEVDRGFDLMISDLMMPTVGGLKLAAELESRGLDLPTIFTSGYAEGVSDHFPEGAQRAFLPKPFSPEDLVAAVRGLLDASLTA